MYLASLTATELAPILAILTGMLTGFYALLKFVLKQAEKTSDADRAERKEFTKTLKDLTSSNERIAQSHEKAAREAEKRNGHLAELQIEARKDVLSAINHICKQEVKEQVVKHQTVNEKE